MDFPNPAAYTMLRGVDALSVHSSCDCIKLFLFIGVISSKKICTKALLPDLCYRIILKIVVLMVFCDLENGSRIYFYNYFVQRTTLKLQLWGLSNLTIGSVVLHLLSVTVSLIFCTFSSSSPASPTFLTCCSVFLFNSYLRL